MISIPISRLRVVRAGVLQWRYYPGPARVVVQDEVQPGQDEGPGHRVEGCGHRPKI